MRSNLNLVLAGAIAAAVAAAVAGCGGDTSSDKQSSSSSSSSETSTARLAIDGLTGRQAVRTGKQARKTIENISQKQRDNLNEVLDDTER
jgi:hypothetical protein